MYKIVDLPLPILIFISLFLSLGSAIFSGLTLGMMTQDLLYLKISSISNENRRRRYAKKLLPLRSDGNLLLVTLLFGNVTINTGFSILLSELTSGWLGFTLSTILIMLLGEIVPQAICSRYGLYIGGFFSPFIRIIQVILYPILKPISFILDKLVGKNNEKIYRREEIYNLLEYHSIRGVISSNELELISRIIFSQKSLSDIVKSINEFEIFDIEAQFDYDTISNYINNGVNKVYIVDNNINISDLYLNYKNFLPYNNSNKYDLIILDVNKNEIMDKQYSSVNMINSPSTNDTCDSDHPKYNDDLNIENGVIIGYIDLSEFARQSKMYKTDCYKILNIINTKCFKKLTNIIISSDMVEILKDRDNLSIIENISNTKDKILSIESSTNISALFDIFYQYNFDHKDVIIAYSVHENHKIKYDGVITQYELFRYLFHSNSSNIFHECE